MGNSVISKSGDPPAVSNTAPSVKEYPVGYETLWAGRGADEREVEYRWVWKNLAPKEHYLYLKVSSVLLDVGCCESEFAEILHRNGWLIWGIDIRDCRASHAFPFFQGDIRRTPFASSSFDQIIAVSSIEHVGMRCYGNEWIDFKHGDRMAILEIYRILRRSGSILLTLPYGSSVGDYWIRYYNEKTLTELLFGLTPTSLTYYLKENGRWRECLESEASQMPSGEGALPNAVVCAKVVK